MPESVIDEIMCSVVPGEVRAAFLSDGHLIDLLIERDGGAGRVGEIFLGRVQRVIPGMAAAFVDLGIGRDGFLPASDARRGREERDIAALATEGEALLVQVTKDAVGDKGPAVTANVTLAGRLLVYAPFQDSVAVSHRISDQGERDRLTAAVEAVAGSGEGFILRTAAEGVEEEALQADVEEVRARWAEIEAARDQADAPAQLRAELDTLPRILRDHARQGLERVLIDDADACAGARRFAEAHLPEVAGLIEHHAGPQPLFDRFGLEDEIEGALWPRVNLPSGGEIVIETVEALTAVDVNTARNTGRGRQRETILETNLEAAPEIARQVRLRNLAGRIVIDFIHMEDSEDRASVLAALRDAFAGDPLPVRIGGFTSLGLAELTRRRGRPSLDQLLREGCNACEGQGRVERPESVAHVALRAVRAEAAADPGTAFAIFAAPEVIAALDAGAAPAREALEAALGRPLVLRGDAELGREAFEIVPASEAEG